LSANTIHALLPNKITRPIATGILAFVTQRFFMQIVVNLNQQELIIIMAKLDLPAVEALIATIATGTADDAATKAAVADLTAKYAALQTSHDTLAASLTNDEGVEATLVSNVSDLTQQLSDHSTAINDIVAKLQAGDNAGALAAAQAVPPVTPPATPPSTSTGAGTDSGTAA
jgi:hypothetical protein